MRKPNALTLTWFVPVIALIGNAILYGVHQSNNPQLLAVHIREFAIVPTQLQKLAYVSLVTVLVLACGAALLHPRGRFFRGMASLHVSAVVAGFLALSVGLLWQSDYWFVAGFFVALLAASALANFEPLRAVVTGRPFRTALAVALVSVIAVYVAVSFLWPITHVTTEANSAVLAYTDAHYAVTVLPGFDLTCCQTTGTVENARYGVMMPLLSALSLKALQALGHGPADLLTAVRVYQVVALALILLALRLLVRRRFLWFAGVVIVLTPVLSMSSESRPNLVGIRYVPFLAGLIVLILLSRSRSRSTDLLVAAGLSALLLVGSPEAGMAMTLGLGAFVVLSGYRPTQPLRSIAAKAVPFAAATLLIYVIAAGLAGRLIDPLSGISGLSNVALFAASGYGGFVTPWLPAAAIVMLFASLAIVSVVMKARQGRASRQDAFQGAIGIIMLAWMPYYVNRQYDSDLWFEFVLLLLLWAPRLQHLDLRVLSSRQGSVAPYSWLSSALVVGLLATTIPGTASAVTAAPGQSTTCAPPATVVLGRCLTSSDAEQVRAHLSYLSGLSPKSQYVVLTDLPSQVRVLGFNDAVPWYDSFGDVPRKQDLQAVIAWIDEHGPRYLLVDDPATEMARELPNLTQQQQDIVRGLTNYRLSGTDSGWLVYERQ